MNFYQTNSILSKNKQKKQENYQNQKMELEISQSTVALLLGGTVGKGLLTKKGAGKQMEYYIFE